MPCCVGTSLEKVHRALPTPTQMALSKLHLCGLVWVAWTDFGGVGVGRRPILGKSDKFSQDSSHPGVDPVYGFTPEPRHCALLDRRGAAQTASARHGRSF